MQLAQFDQATREISYAPPVAVSRFKSTDYYYISGYSVDECVTKQHNLYIDGKLTPAEQAHDLTTDQFTQSGSFASAGVDFSDDWLRLITQVVTDATLVDGNTYSKGPSEKYRVQFKLSKERKIHELSALLDRMGVNYSLLPATKSDSNILQPYYIRFYGEWARKVARDTLRMHKQFPASFRSLNKAQLMVVLDTLTVTDGRKSSPSVIEWSSTSRHDIEVIQQACIHNGIDTRATFVENPSGFPGSVRKPLWILHIKLDGCAKQARPVTRTDGDVERTFTAVQMPLGTIITRRNGKVSFTGNCRLFQKPQAKGAVKNNLDWLLAKQLEIQLADDKRIQFHIPNSLDCFYQVYGKTFCLTHGDQFKGGSGIAGLWSAILLGHARKLKRQQALGRPFDWLILGHWHQLTLGKGIIVNGSTVGYDEYAYKNNFSYEVPSQALFINHPTHDLTHWLPVYLEAKQKQADEWIAWSK
jgi:hypothetical protein